MIATGTSTLINQLGIYYWKVAGDHEKAGQLFFEALQAHQKVNGESHRDTMLCKIQLATYLADSTEAIEWRLAEDYYRQALV
eukprot:COSAG02_NODE_48956_length_330_cov_0.839827_1_plen_81_part_01